MPCGDAAFAASRETLILPDDARCPAYLGVYGGKLTTYRREAAKVLALIARNMPDMQPVDTRRISLAPSEHKPR